MRSNTFWIIVGVLAVLAMAALFLSYWMVTLGLGIIIVGLVVSRTMRANHPKPTE